MVLSCFACNNLRGRMPALEFAVQQLAAGAAVQQDLLDAAWARALGSEAFRVGVGALVETLYASDVAGMEAAEPILVKTEALWWLRLPVRVIAGRYFALKDELEAQLASINATIEPLHDKSGSELSEAVTAALPGTHERVLAFMLWRGRSELAHELLFRRAIASEFATALLDALQPAATAA